MSTQAELILESRWPLIRSSERKSPRSLILSLDEQRAAEIEAAWGEEIKRRLESIRKGEVQLVPWDEMMRSMRERLNAKTTT